MCRNLFRPSCQCRPLSFCGYCERCSCGGRLCSRMRRCIPQITKIRLLLLTFILGAVFLFLNITEKDIKDSEIYIPIDGARMKRYLDCSSLYRNTARYNETSKGLRITRIVHQTWIDSNVPKVSAKWIKKWHKTNPNWDYWFWTDQDIEHFIQKKYPQFTSLYDNFPKLHAGIQRADMMRYFILYEFGGVYADLDLEPIRSLDPIIEKFPCVFSEEPEEHSKILRPKFLNEYGTLVCNAFIASRPGHPFLKYIIDHLYESFNRTTKTKSVMYSTGPAMVSILHAEYIKTGPDSCHSETDRVIISPSKYFMGIYDVAQTPYLAHLCSEKEELPEFRSKACGRLIRRMFRNKPGKDTFTIHHWFHTWTPKGKKYLPGKGHPSVPIKSLIPNAKLVSDMYGFL